MFWEFIVPLIIVLVVCYCLLPKFKYGVDRQIMKTNSLLNEITLNDLRNEYENNDLARKNAQLNTQENEHTNNKNKKALNYPPELRLDTCSAMKVDACPVGCYKQCTNNVMTHPKCNCSDQKSFEVCSDNDMNDLLTMDEVLQNEAKDYGKYAIRVNKWNIGETEFNDPGNLHIQRTNPYVEEL
jgi:hypothetical protein